MAGNDASAVRLTTLGTGTASPHPHRVNAGHLIESGDTRILMDCGSGVVHRLATLGLDWRTITHLAITHFHPDHILDIPTLFYAWRYGTLPPRREPLVVIGPLGTNDMLSRFESLLGGPGELRDLGFAIDVHELRSGEDLRAGSARISALHVPHTAESVAYSIVAGGARIVYTGDTGFDAGLGEWATGCEVFLCECSLPQSMAIPTHLTPEQCGDLAAIAKPRQLVLTHFYPPVEVMPVAEVIAEKYAGPVTLATDGWFIDLKEG